MSGTEAVKSFFEPGSAPETRRRTVNYGVFVTPAYVLVRLKSGGLPVA